MGEQNRTRTAASADEAAAWALHESLPRPLPADGVPHVIHHQAWDTGEVRTSRFKLRRIAAV